MPSDMDKRVVATSHRRHHHNNHLNQHRPDCSHRNTHAHARNEPAPFSISADLHLLPDQSNPERNTRRTDTSHQPRQDTPTPSDVNTTSSPSIPGSEPEASQNPAQTEGRSEAVVETVTVSTQARDETAPPNASSDEPSAAPSLTASESSSQQEDPSPTPTTSPPPPPSSSDVPPQPTTTPPDGNNEGQQSTTSPQPEITTSPPPESPPTTSPQPPSPPSPSATSATEQQWIPSSSQESVAAETQSSSSVPIVEQQPSPTAGPSSSDVVAAVIAGVSSSSSSALVSPSSAAAAAVQSSRSIAGASGTTLTFNSQATNKGVTMSQTRVASSAPSASSPAEAASASSESQGLPSGTKAGIAIGVIAAVGAALFAIFYCIRRRKSSNNLVLSRGNPNSNVYAFGGYGAAEEKGSNLRRNGTQHSALDFSDGPLPQSRSRWRHLSSLPLPFAGARDIGQRGSMAGGPGMAGVGSSPSRFDSANPSLDQSRGAYPYAKSESEYDDDNDHDHGPPLQVAEDDASHFRNTNYDDWLAYDGAVAFDHESAPTSPIKASPPVKGGSSSPGPQLRHPQPQVSRRVPVPSLGPDFSASPKTNPYAFTPGEGNSAYNQEDSKTTASYGISSATSTVGDVYDAYGSPQPVLRGLPFLRVTPPPVQAQQFAEPQSATVGLAA